MKKRLQFVVCVLLLVTSILAFSICPLAISEEMTHKYEEGSLKHINGLWYTYHTDTAASYTSASATLTFQRSDSLLASIEASLLVENEYSYNESSNAVQGFEVTTSVDNISYREGVPVNGVITAAIGTYRIGRGTTVVSSVY